MSISVGAIVVTALGLVVGIGGMWLAWKLVLRLPGERPGSVDETAEDEAAGEQKTEVES